jgi:hypothetical protein
MRFIRSSSFEEFVRWYLMRERRKHGLIPNLGGMSWPAALSGMRSEHAGKLRPWFDRARWSIVCFETLEETLKLVCVDNPESRRNRFIRSGPDSRLLGSVLNAVRETGFFEEGGGPQASERYYRDEGIEVFRRTWPQLCDAERLALCSLNDDELRENPSGSHYINDGFGRLLTVTYLIVYEGREYRPVEAFLAEQT